MTEQKFPITLPNGVVIEDLIVGGLKVHQPDWKPPTWVERAEGGGYNAISRFGVVCHYESKAHADQNTTARNNYIRHMSDRRILREVGLL